MRQPFESDISHLNLAFLFNGIDHPFLPMALSVGAKMRLWALNIKAPTGEGGCPGKIGVKRSKRHYRCRMKVQMENDWWSHSRCP